MIKSIAECIFVRLPFKFIIILFIKGYEDATPHTIIIRYFPSYLGVLTLGKIRKLSVRITKHTILLIPETPI